MRSLGINHNCAQLERRFSDLDGDTAHLGDCSRQSMAYREQLQGN
jgi:hypothetical protein